MRRATMHARNADRVADRAGLHWSVPRRRRRRALVAACCALLPLMALPAPAAAAPAEISAEGADLVAISLVGDRLSVTVRDADQVGRGADGHDPEQVRLPGDTAPAGLFGTVPANPGFGFLGAADTPVWALAPADGDHSTFPAWDTTGVAPQRLTGEAGVDLELREVEGPGRFSAYTLSPVGIPEVLLGSAPDAPRRTTLPAGTRAGGMVWAFDAPGAYEIEIAARVNLAGGGTADDTTTYHVDVPEFPATAAALPGLETALSAPGAAPPPAPQRLAQQSDPEQDPGGDQNGQADEQVVIGDGHVDIGPRFVDGTWTIQVKDDTVSPHVWRDLHNVVLQVVDDAEIEIPAGADFEFLGAPGDPVWLLPQAQQQGILWPGWNTEHSSVVEQVSGDTTWRLHEVSGPGTFVLFLTGSFGQSQVEFDSGADLPQEMSIPPRTHAHGNWAFSEPGIYHLTIEMSATTTGGDEVSDTRTLAFAVGDVDPGTGFPPPGGGGPGGGPDGDDDTGGGKMPLTGSGILLTLLIAGAVLVAAGTILLLLSRRRRRAAQPISAGIGPQSGSTAQPDNTRQSSGTAEPSGPERA